MTGDGYDEPGRPRGREPRRAHRSSRPLWLGGLGPGPDGSGAHPAGYDPGADAWDPEDSICCDACTVPHDPATCEHCADMRAGRRPVGPEEDPDLGDIVVILLVSTLTGLRDRLQRDGYESAACLVHDLVEVADDYVMRYQA